MGPEMAPKPPNVRAPRRSRGAPLDCIAMGPEMAPKPPNVRAAPAKPWRPSGLRRDGPEMAPKPPNVRAAPAKPWRPSGLRSDYLPICFNRYAFTGGVIGYGSSPLGPNHLS